MDPELVTSRKSLVRELRSSHRALVLTITVMLLLNAAASSYLVLVGQPAIKHLTELTRLARISHAAMLDEETGLRGWLATGESRFLSPYASGKRTVASESENLLAGAAGDPEMTRLVVATMVAREGWQSWANRAEAMRVTEAQRSSGVLTLFLIEGKGSFDTYRQAEAQSTAFISARRDEAMDRQRMALLAIPLALVLVTAVVGARARFRRRRLTRTVLAPLTGLLTTIEALGAGNLAARPPLSSGVAELDAMGIALTTLAGDLASAQELAHARELRLGLLAARLEMVVRVAREVSGSLSIRYVSEAVADAAAELLGAPVTLWVRTAEGGFTAARRSQDPHGRTPPSDLNAPAIVQDSAAAARSLRDAGSSAYPLVLAGMVVGVLNVDTPAADPDTGQVLEALLSTAAAALESARLNSAAHERADLDAMTQLPNRRRMDADLRAEWDRCVRYDRPLTFVMLDLDHFKALNDTFGHPAGDAALHEVALALTARLRATDTAYRYGGEEFAVLLRETDADAGAIVAESLRCAIAGITVAGFDLSVTASLGVADRDPRMREPSDIIAAADAALYTAKRLGRDRVIQSTSSTPTGSASIR
ncbi:MAG: diguanylate cyclase [Rhodoglobus sp.]